MCAWSLPVCSSALSATSAVLDKLISALVRNSGNPPLWTDLQGHPLEPSSMLVCPSASTWSVGRTRERVRRSRLEIVHLGVFPWVGGR